MYDLFFGKDKIDIYKEIVYYDFFIFFKDRSIFLINTNVTKNCNRIGVTSINDIDVFLLM